ncbi:MAG: DeoR/GlpR family DNA-binding transcription regulator [Pacificimonas sp.]
MRKTERHRFILKALDEEGFLSVEALSARIETSLVTIRRDLKALDDEGLLSRVHGGAERQTTQRHTLVGRSFERNMARNRSAKRRIAARAAQLCGDGDSIIVDGGTTTYELGPHLAGRGTQVLTNSLHIISGLIEDPATRLIVPGGEVFAEQNIILSPSEDDGISDFRAGTMFLGAEALCTDGVRQSDMLLVHAERRLLKLATRVVLLVDSSKFEANAPLKLCELSKIDTVITERAPPPRLANALSEANVMTIVASK